VPGGGAGGRQRGSVEFEGCDTFGKCHKAHPACHTEAMADAADCHFRQLLSSKQRLPMANTVHHQNNARLVFLMRKCCATGPTNQVVLDMHSRVHFATCLWCEVGALLQENGNVQLSGVAVIVCI
jgi:hypothetical protein